MPSSPVPENQPIRILLVAEERLFRAALEKLVESWPEYEVVGETGSKEETFQLLQRTAPDIVLLTLAGDSQSLEIVTQLAEACGKGRLLVLGGDNVTALAAKIVRLGAHGVVGRNKSPDELRRAMKTVHEGQELWLDRASLMSLVLGWPQQVQNQANLDLLTHREREVVSFVAKGLTNKEVGGRLYISETTVRHHLTTIFGKLEVRNRFELIDLLYRNRVVVSPKSPATGI